MAYMDQEKKKNLAPAIKSVFKKYNVKGSISVRHHSALVVTLKQGAIDFIGNYNEHTKTRTNLGRPVTPHNYDFMSVNEYYTDEQYTCEAKEFMSEMIDAMNGVETDDPNFDKSDIQSDYHHVGYYIDLNIGKFDKPYAVIK